MRPKVLLVEPIGDPGTKLLRELADIKILPALSQRLVISHIRDADAVIIRAMLRVDRQAIDAARQLRVIGRFGVGIDNIDVERATEVGIPVVWTPEANCAAVADFTLGLILAIARKIPIADRTLRGGAPWQKRHEFVGTDVSQKVLGIIGFGRIGRAVAERAKGFRMNVLVYDPLLDRDIVAGRGASPVALDELLTQSDFVSVHVPLTPETINLIGEREIKMMKTQAFIINTARGGVVDTRALLKALKARRIAGAALDTFDKEPPSRRGLMFRLDNIITTPHIAAFTREALEKTSTMVAEGVLSVLRKERPQFVFNTSVFEKRGMINNQRRF